MKIARAIVSLLPALIVLLGPGTAPTLCQTKRAQDELNTAYRGKVFLLRNFYSDGDLSYDQNGELVGQATRGSWTLARIEITNISLTAQGIEIAGNRVGTLYRDEKPGLFRVGELKIHVARPVSEVDTEATLHPVLTKIFIGSDEDLRTALPDYWSYYLNGTDSKSRSTAWRASLQKNTARAGTAEVTPKAGSVSPPRVVYEPDPKYTKEAESHHIEGMCLLATVIDNTGKAENIGILQPLGMGLDEQAVLALQQWKFRPATKNGQPISVQIEVEIYFKCCPGRT